MIEQPFSFTPVVIIGAGRSGTNILRDMLTTLPDFATWPCDEINPIWRHGNTHWPTDEIPPERASPSVKRKIRAAFQRLWERQGKPSFVVEKTCANTLRVPFVDRVLPEARFIYIVRDGVDVVASAQRRWQGKLELPGLPYFAAKARFTPLSDLPRYFASFLRSRLSLALGQKRRLATWGPRFYGMQELAGTPLEEICAMQWAACIDRSDKAFAQLDPSRVLTFRYEDFTADPRETLLSILTFLQTQASEDQVDAATSIVRQTSVGKGRAEANLLSNAVNDILAAPLRAHGY